MNELVVNSSLELKQVLDKVSMDSTSLDFGWTFYLSQQDFGWLVWVEFKRIDSDTGEPGVGKSRSEIIWKGATETAVVKTAWLLLELTVRHELMEAFRYKGVRPFDPHNAIDDLCRASRRP